MNIAEKVIRPGVEDVAREALAHGQEVAFQVTRPTLNQRCPRWGEHFGWVCVCTRGELQTYAAQRVSGAANKIANKESANKEDVCKCGRPTRPRGKDCWTCYRAKKEPA